MLNQLESAMPYAAVSADNPLFLYEVRRIRWGQTAWQLMSYSLAAWWFVPFFMASLWVLLLDDHSSPVISDARDHYIVFLFVFGVGANFILDMVSITASLRGVACERQAGRWESLRLTNLCPEQFISAKHAAAQVRAWRVMALVVSLRLSLVVFLMIRIELLPTLFLLIGYCVVYILEPLCRLRALTAVGLAVSARICNTAYALLASSAAILAAWAVQGSIFLLVCGWLLVKYGASSIPVLVCFQPLILVALAWSFYAICRRVERWSLHHAALHIFCQD
jgi:hypothetical protein